MKLVVLFIVSMISSQTFAIPPTPAEAAARDELSMPKAPSKIKFADVCSYDTWSTKLTCRDVGGNVIIDRKRMYKSWSVTEHDKLPVFSLMKRLGFDVKSTMKIGYTFEVIFFRNPAVTPAQG